MMFSERRSTKYVNLYASGGSSGGGSRGRGVGNLEEIDDGNAMRYKIAHHFYNTTEITEMRF